MIKIFRTRDNTLLPQESISSDCWVHLESPTKGEIQRIESTLEIPRDFLVDPLDVDERSRAIVDDGMPLLIVRVPVYDADKEIAYTTIPLGIIMLPENIVTVCAQPLVVIQNLLAGNKRHLHTAERSRLVLQIISGCNLQFLRYLREINASTTQMEEDILRSSRNEQLIYISRLIKSLVYFTTSLNANQAMLHTMTRLKILRLGELEEELLEHVLLDNQQALDMSNIYSNILTGMMSAFASLISNNLNSIVKILTMVTIIIMGPNLVASIYGMNVPLPFADRPHAFYLPLALGAILSIFTFLFFLKKKWFY